MRIVMCFFARRLTKGASPEVHDGSTKIIDCMCCGRAERDEKSAGLAVRRLLLRCSSGITTVLPPHCSHLDQTIRLKYPIFNEHAGMVR